MCVTIICVDANVFGKVMEVKAKVLGREMVKQNKTKYRRYRQVGPIEKLGTEERSGMESVNKRMKSLHRTSRNQRNSTEGRVFALHVTNPGQF